MLQKGVILCISVTLSVFCLTAGAYGATYPGDIDGDCSVTWEDMRLLSLTWLTGGCDDSLDADCDVDFEDYAVFAKDWLQTVPQFNGVTYHVTNMEDYNPASEPRVTGSLRDRIALAAADGVASRIIFDVDGTIYAHAAILIDWDNSYLTICGTDAPGDGITIDFGGAAGDHNGPTAYSGITIGTGNCRLCNLHITQTKRNTDGVRILGSNNIVERCTMTWCRDEGISVETNRGNVAAFNRIEYCGTQPGDGSDDDGNPDGRGLSIFYGGSAVVVGNYVGDNCRGVLCQGDSTGAASTDTFGDFRNNRIAYNHQTFGLNVQSAGPGSIYPAYANFINNTINNNTHHGVRYMNNVTYYLGRANNSLPNTNILIDNDENFDYQYGTPTEVFTLITWADTPYPSWLIGAATPANAGSVGQGSGRCQCNFCE